MDRAPAIDPNTLPVHPHPGFKVFRQFHDPALRSAAGRLWRMGPKAAALFPGDSQADRVARALAARRVLSVKEVVESFEAYARARRTARGPVVGDLCCGHGLVGMIFALMERDVERVILLDHAFPASFRAVLDAVTEVGPWVPAKITVLTGAVRERAVAVLPPGASVVGVHACGKRTDHVLDAARALGGAVAVVPCCYGKGTAPTSKALAGALGAGLAADVARTQALEAAGYKVAWTRLPPEVTPMNRVILGAPPGSR